MTNNEALLSDQVFQLNAFLWALSDIPSGGPIEPVLRKAGYQLNSIGRKIIVPGDEKVVSALAKLTGNRDRSSCRPDLWLRHASDSVDPIIELKARGFSPDSSNRRQAFKLIASTSDLSLSLGEQTKRLGHVIYATIDKDVANLSDTLNYLANALAAETVIASPTGVIGLSIVEGGMALSSPFPADLPAPLAKALMEPAIVLRQIDVNDLQPLYFIPWIPGIEDSQHAQFRTIGLNELTARVYTQILAKVGRVRIPATLTLCAIELLNRATFGVFGKWRDTDRKQFSAAVVKITERVLAPVVQVRSVGSEHVEVDLPDDESQSSAIERLEQTDPSNTGANIEAAIEEPPTLFD